MKKYHKKEAILKMNQLGKQKRPFMFIIDFEMRKIIIEKLDELSEQITFNFNGVSNRELLENESFKPLSISKFPIDKASYASYFSQIIEEIKYGNSFLLNLTAKTPILSNYSLEDLYNQTIAKYKLLLKDEFVCFSPESFVKIIDGCISTYPMKGTISANIESAAENLLNDKKESAEHSTIVDLLRNDLSQVAKAVQLKRFKYLDEIQTHQGAIYQMSSKIEGKLDKDYHQKLGDILFKLLPAGSVSGAPKKKTLEIIKAVESEERGYYCGICGIFDGENLDSGVMIRFIENENDALFFRSGGGITFMSDLEKEYQELIDKIYVPINRNDKNLQGKSLQHRLSRQAT